MSYPNNPNNNNDPRGAYPTAPKQRSPWMYVLFGCLGLFVITFGGCAILGVLGYNQVKQSMNAPIDKAAIARDFEGIPVYPDATISEEGSKAIRGVLGLVARFTPGKKFMSVAYNVKDPEEKVMEWYDAKMIEAGYTPTKETFQMQNGGVGESKGIVKMYKKDKDLVQIQARRGAKGEALILVRFSGFTEAELAGFGKK